MKLNLAIDEAGRALGFLHFCPGCDAMHLVPTRWRFNGDYEAPTFEPSLVQNPGDAATRCHYWIRAGRLVFCSDSHHALAHQEVELPDIPKEFQ